MQNNQKITAWITLNQPRKPVKYITE